MVNFPTALDDSTVLPNPVGSVPTLNPGSALAHATLHTNENLAILALESKVGIDGSTDTNSLDYKVSQSAQLASPAFTGIPTAPTASLNTSTTQLASTAFVTNQAATAAPIMDGTVAVGSSKTFARADHVHASDTSRASLASPAFTGVPTAPTAAVNTNTIQIASTAFVLAQIISGIATSLVSPAFTGIPTAPTPAINTNTTQLSTTAFVLGQAATVAPIMDSTATIGTGTTFARADHIHPSDTSRASLASPTFTGIPLAPTAAVDVNTTQLATTAFVLGQLSLSTDSNPLIDGVASKGISTHGARNDHVHPTDTTRSPALSIVALQTSNYTPVPNVFVPVDTSISSVTVTLPNAPPDGSYIGLGLVAGGVNLLTVAASGSDVFNKPSSGIISLTLNLINQVYILKYSATPAVWYVQSTSISLSSLDSRYVSLVSPAFTGIPTAPTATVGTNTTQLATTAFVLANSSVSGTYAPLASPAFTGIPTAPNAVGGTNTTQIATTAFVIANSAPISSPVFTGVPVAPTATVGTNTTQIATTAFVLSQIGTGSIYAPLVSPVFTGVPVAPTASAHSSSTQIATTAYVDSAVSSSGGGTVSGPGTTVSGHIVTWNATNGTLVADGGIALSSLSSGIAPFMLMGV